MKGRAVDGPSAEAPSVSEAGWALALGKYAFLALGCLEVAVPVFR